MDPRWLPQAPYPLAPGFQTACYLPWLKVSVALRYVLSLPWILEAWRPTIASLGPGFIRPRRGPLGAVVRPQKGLRRDCVAPTWQEQ
jgi:hypothetical protein